MKPLDWRLARSGLTAIHIGGSMKIAVYFHPKSLSQQQYGSAIAELEAAGASHPAGRVHHSCFGPEGDLMVYEIWESQQAFEEYGHVLMPILQRTGIDPGTPDVMAVHNIIA
jgi:hypothetical protein